MKSRTKKVINMLEDLFSNKYDPFLFSIDFPNFCFENYDDLEKENKGLGYYLDQNIPDICDKGEPSFDSLEMINELKKIYQHIKENYTN